MKLKTNKDNDNDQQSSKSTKTMDSTSHSSQHYSDEERPDSPESSPDEDFKSYYSRSKKNEQRYDNF
jgi:hypothetical protein